MISTLIKLFLDKTNNFKKINKFWSEQKFDGQVFETSYFLDGCDTKEAFERLKTSKYTDTCITYNINDHGYRVLENVSPKPTTKNIIACFGCSQTFGVGIKYEETWPHQLEVLTENKFNVKNYGISGASSDTISRLIYCYLLDHKPRAICCLLPDMFRRELFDSSSSLSPKNFTNIGDNEELLQFCSKHKYNVLDWRAYKRLSGEENSIFNFIKNLKFIEALCEAKNVPLYTLTWDFYFLSLIKLKMFHSPSNIINSDQKSCDVLLNWNKLEKARDGIHFGSSVQKLFAQKFAEQLK